MKNLPVFKRAKNLYYGGNVRFKDESPRKIYFDCEDMVSGKTHMVEFDKTDKGIIADCDCTSRSLSKGSPTFCSHILAAIFKTYHETKMPKGH